MSHTDLERRNFPIPMRWSHASSDPARPADGPRPARRSLIRSKRLPRCLSYAPNLASALICRPHPVGVTSTLQPGAAIKSP